MTVLPFIPKDDPELPDHYGMKIFYITGKMEEFDLASHHLNKEISMIEFVLKDDIWNWVPLSSISRIEFDKRFSKIIALKEKQSAKPRD